MAWSSAAAERGGGVSIAPERMYIHRPSLLQLGIHKPSDRRRGDPLRSLFYFRIVPDCAKQAMNGNGRGPDRPFLPGASARLQNFLKT